MNFANLTAEERLLCDRVEDLCRRCEKSYTPQFTAFLDEKQGELARRTLIRLGWADYLLYGGYSEAARCMLGIFPSCTEPDTELFPIRAVTLTYRPEDELTHRDLLGALMGLLIKREAVGDIVVGEGRSVLFVTQPVAAVVLSELTKAGRVGVKAVSGVGGELPQSRGFDELSGTVSSLRLDCIIALITRLSREKAAALLRSGLVTLEFSPCDDAAKRIEAGNRISVRGYGKFIVDNVDGVTKKGRIRVSIKKHI